MDWAVVLAQRRPLVGGVGVSEPSGRADRASAVPIANSPAPLRTRRMATAGDTILEKQKNKVNGQEADFKGVRARATAVPRN